MSQEQIPASVDPEQLVFDALPVELREKVKEFTGANTPEATLKAAAVMLGNGIPVREICRELNVSPHLLPIAARRFPALVATQKERLAERWALVERVCQEGALDMALNNPGKVKFQEWVMGGGIAGTKRAEAAGEPGLVIEHRHEVGAETRSWLDRFQKERATVAIDVESIESVADCSGNDGLAGGDTVVDTSADGAQVGRMLAAGEDLEDGGGAGGVAFSKRAAATDRLGAQNFPAKSGGVEGER